MQNDSKHVIRVLHNLNGAAKELSEVIFSFANLLECTPLHFMGKDTEERR